MASTDEANSDNKKTCSIMKYLGINVCQKGSKPCPVHVASGASYSLLAVNMFSPELMHKISPSRDLTNVFMGGALLGGSMYLYYRPHLAAVQDKRQRLLFSVYGSTMFTLGSLLLWAMTRVLVPDNTPVRAAVALGSSIVLLKTGKAYLDVIDANPKSK